MRIPIETEAPMTILSQTAFFGDLTPVQLDKVVAVTRVLDLAEGDLVYRFGERAQSVYVLVRGMVRFAVGFGERHTNAGDILRRGEVFGWAALTPSCNRRIATASCLTSCVLLEIDGSSLLELMESDHTMGYRLAIQLNQLVTGTLSTFAGG